ncbi:MAG TPA: hypothetical protein VJB70_02205 [Candidatus Paceibacterota bacterium]
MYYRKIYYSLLLDMFFGKQHKKLVRNIWIVLSILVIVSMTLLYFPIFN